MLPQPTRLEVAGARLAVREWGEPGSPTVFFWHALGTVTSGAYAAELAPALVDEGFRVVSPDGPGHGDSAPLAPERYRLQSLVELVGELLDELGVERTVFVGHSWGAMIGAHFAAAHPERVRALVLLDAGYADPQEQPGFDPDATPAALRERAHAMLAVRWTDWSAFFADARDGIPRWTPDLADVFRAGVTEENGGLRPAVEPDARAAAISALYFDGTMSETWPALAASGIPLLLLVATEPQDQEAFRTSACARFKAAVPHAVVRRVEGARHDLLVDAGPEVAADLAGWLRQTL
jgi:pimeloyl-ACP methyl ester carboxylesterase